MEESVGILIIAKDTNNFLLLHRASKPIVWSTLTGKMDVKGETPIETIRREIEEEINVSPNFIKNISKIGVTVDKKIFHIFVGFVDNEFKPKLKLDENDDFGWFNEFNLPSPIHKKWDKTFQLVKPFLSLKEEIMNKINDLINDKKN
jgi:8-oxo-dGTP pyrophosphatase MutT (NUDIX family)